MGMIIIGPVTTLLYCIPSELAQFKDRLYL
jgi:hypothetical protein